jgi:protoporphyrinogen oxidase
MYPRKGISVLFENMAKAVRAGGNCLLLDSTVVRLERDGDRIRRVVYTRDGVEETIECEGIISTLPLPLLVDLIHPALPPPVAAHAKKLRYRSLKLIYVALKRDKLTDYHWVYLLDEQFRVNRMSEQKNVSPEMIPPGRTVLCIELSCWREEPVWKASDEEVYRIALDDMMRMGYGITESEVEDYFVTDIPTAYPVYELNFEDHLIPVLEGVHAVPNLLTIGRHGLFLNNSMDDNVLLGMKVGDRIAQHGFDSQSWLSEMLAFMNLRFQGK